MITNAKNKSVMTLGHNLQLGVDGYYTENNSTYPSGTDVQIQTLTKADGVLKDYMATPKNPFTGSTYTETGAGSDQGKIEYSLVDDVYTISCYAKDGTTLLTTFSNSPSNTGN